MAYTAIATANTNLEKQGILRIARSQDTKGLMSADATWYTQAADKDGSIIWQAQYAKSGSEADLAEFHERMQELQKQGLARKADAEFDIGGLFIKRQQKLEHVVRVFEGGKEHTIYINADPEIARAINGANREIAKKWALLVGRGTRLVAAKSDRRNGGR
jgi:hypothetical protein